MPRFTSDLAFQWIDEDTLQLTLSYNKLLELLQHIEYEDHISNQRDATFYALY